MDLKVIDLLKIEKTEQLSKIKTLKGGVEYWIDEKDRDTLRLTELIEEFNEIIEHRKYTVRNLAACQADHRKAVDRLERINRAIKALEDLEDLED